MQRMLIVIILLISSYVDIAFYTMNHANGFSSHD